MTQDNTSTASHSFRRAIFSLSVWLTPFFAFLAIALISFFSYLVQLNTLDVNRTESVSKTDDQAIASLNKTFKEIIDIGNDVSNLDGSNPEEVAGNLRRYVGSELLSHENYGIVFLSYITLLEDEYTFVDNISTSEFKDPGRSLIGTPVKGFMDLESEFEAVQQNGGVQVSNTFRSNAFLSNENVYISIVFPHYRNIVGQDNQLSGFITATVGLDSFLQHTQEHSQGFRIFRILDRNDNVVASNRVEIQNDDIELLRQNIDIGSRRFTFEYDHYKAPLFANSSMEFENFLRNLGIGFIVFVFFFVLKYRETRARQLADQAEKEIRETDTRFSALIEKSTDLTIVLNSSGKIIFASPSVDDQIGYEHREIIGSQIIGYLDGDDSRKKALHALFKLRKGETPGAFEVKVKTKENQTKVFECLITDLRQDEAIKGIVCNSRDVTDRKKAQENEKKARELYENALENAPTGVALVHRDGSCFYCNQALKSFFGEEDVDIHSKKLRDFIVDEDKFAFSDMWNSLSARQEESTKSELRFKHPDGRHRWGLISIRPVYDDNIFQYYVIQIEDTTERRNIAERLEYQAIHDPLTGLPNRLLFVDRLEVALQRSKRTGLGVTVLFLDLDRFKIVNDSLGHAAGDRLLIAVSDRIKASVRPNDTVARFGGDEFVILCEDISDQNQIDEITKRLLETINRPILLEEGEVYVTASIGIARSLAGEESPETILRDADTAMYRAKDDGRNKSAVFDERTHARAVANLETGNGMFRALSQDEFRVRYQPIIELSSGRLFGFEALVYWEDPIKGHVPPNEFIALAEETGVIVPLGMKIFETACRTLKDWHDKSEDAQGLNMSINLSPRQLAEPTLFNEVKKILKKTGVNPDRIWFEITESALMVDAESTIGMLDQLRNLGVHLEVDDFGTGFSSLSYLKKFPLDAIKVDQSFIDGLGTEAEDTAIVTAVISLSHALGLQVIAEGVENPYQLAELKTLGCEYAQGFYFAPANSKSHWDKVITTDKLWNFATETT